MDILCVQQSQMHYFPVTAPFMALLLLAFAVLVALIEFGVIGYAYEKMGVNRHWVLAILLLSLLGSAVNIPVAELPAKKIVVEKTVNFFGVTYTVPTVEHKQGTIIAVNLGGALVPIGLSVYLLFRHRIYLQSAIGVAVVTLVVHLLAQPVRGVGIAIPPLLPPIVAAVTALLISRQYAAPLAYIAGSMGCLLGADVLNLYRIGDLGAPITSIGGAGISDGVFLTGVIAVLLA